MATRTESPPPHPRTLTSQPLPMPHKANAANTAPLDRRPIVISGPSGVGKGTLYKLLFKNHPDCFAVTVSHTTRQPRPGERDAVDYHFVSMQAFEDLIAQDGFVEHAKFGGNRYGTSKMTIEEQTKKGKLVVLDIEMEVRTFRNTRSRGSPGVLTKSTGRQADQEVQHSRPLRLHRPSVDGGSGSSASRTRHRD